MPFSFSDTDIERIEKILGVTAKKVDSLARFELSDEDSGRRITLEIHRMVVTPGLSDGEFTSLVSVYAPASFLQLQGKVRLFLPKKKNWSLLL